MFIALDANDKRISIENATKDDKYFCPICGKQLIIKAETSFAVKTHFAHRRTECLDSWSHDMSEWHLSWQKQFPEQYREVIIERNGVKHRADICINGTVIEFQHSPITCEEIAARNEFYLSCGYKVVWVFDATNQIKNYFEETIDPMKCREDDLCWKRAKQQFAISMPPQVTVYLQYNTHTLYSIYLEQKMDIMLLLTKLAPKDLKFFQTKYYIFPSNFLKEYGVGFNEDILSVTDIVNETKVFVQRERMRQYEEKRKQVMNRLISKNRSKRRWHL